MRAPCTTLRPMPPRPNTTTLAPGLDLGRVDHRADAGSDAAADVADLVERRVLADLGQRDLRQHRVVGEGRAAHVVVDRLAADREAAGAVGHHALALGRADRGAQVGLARQAGFALRGIPACRAGSRGRPSSARSRRARRRPPRPRPRGRGWRGTGLPDRRRSSVNLSVWQMPVALISTSTSPAFGPSSCTVSITSGLPASWATAARTSISSLPARIGPEVIRPPRVAQSARGPGRSPRPPAP